MPLASRSRSERLRVALNQVRVQAVHAKPLMITQQAHEDCGTPFMTTSVTLLHPGRRGSISRSGSISSIYATSIHLAKDLGLSQKKYTQAFVTICSNVTMPCQIISELLTCIPKRLHQPRLPQPRLPRSPQPRLTRLTQPRLPRSPQPR